jgi:archaeal flagellar protein FlaJ
MAKYVVRRKFVSSVPRRPGSQITRLLAYAGIDTPPELWMGGRLFLAFIVSVLAATAPFIAIALTNQDYGYGTLSKLNIAFFLGASVLAFFIGFIGFLAMTYLHLYYIIHDRTKRVEEILPDFLLMVAAHMHAGLTPFAALQAAARPEFGPMEKEIRDIGARSMGSETFTDAIEQLTWRIDSPMLRRTIAFFENGLRSGGKLAQLLETSAEEIRDLDEIRRETVLNTRTYTIFLVFILLGGLPLLLAISTEFLALFSDMQKQISTDDASTSVSSAISPQVKISPEFVNAMAIVIIIGNSILVGVFIGVIGEGKVLYGLKYSPPMAIVAFVIFTIIKSFLSTILGALK